MYNIFLKRRCECEKRLVLIFWSSIFYDVFPLFSNKNCFVNNDNLEIYGEIVKNKKRVFLLQKLIIVK
jgi:hypothetical protein